MKANEFLLTPGPLPWRLDCMKRNPKSGVVYAADGRLVCVAAIGNAREIVRMANLFYTAPRRGAPEARKPPRQETGPSPANLEGTR
jgi:hypothetical protein